MLRCGRALARTMRTASSLSLTSRTGTGSAGAKLGPRRSCREPEGRHAAAQGTRIGRLRASSGSAEGGPAVATQERKASSDQIREGGSKGLVDINPPRGTRDFFPDDKRLQSWLFGHFQAVSELHGFEAVDFPVLEAEELYVRKAGEEITDQLYNFEDKGGRRVTLRPELTPSLARLVLQRGKGLALPAKWWAIGQCWRYERATRGRRREHYQWNMDIVGVPGVEAEAELLAALVRLFRRLGLEPTDVGIKVSSRKVLAAVLQRYGVPAESFGRVCVAVDKLEKLPRDKVEAELGALGLPPEAVSGVLAALATRSVPELSALLGPEGAEATAELAQLWELGEAAGLADWLVFDASVVRGLAYYTGIVFEGFDRAGQLRAICGGGRYDRLLGTFGGEDRPCAGFGFGDAVIVELLKERGLLPELPHQVDDLVVALDDSLRPAACGVAARLRDAGRRVDLALEAKRLKWAFKQAERVGAARLVLVAPDEWAAGAVRVKVLATGEQRDVPLDQL